MTDSPDLPRLTPAQLGRLPLFPGPGVDIEALWCWAAGALREEISEERRQFLRPSYLRALRRAQGWL